jgi:predicted nucleic acid-binding protein
LTFFIDTNVPIYANGRPSEFKQPCIAIIRAASVGVLDACVDVGVLQEIAYRYFGIRRLADGIDIARDLAASVPVILPIELSDGLMMMDVLEQGLALPPLDALHYAVMLRHGITHIITADAHFDALPGITRIDPRNADAIIA